MSRPRQTRPPSSRVAPIAVLAAVAVASAGYAWTRIDHDPPDASWLPLELAVEGLDCAFWCSVKVSDAIEALPGARVDGVDTGAGTVRVRYDPARRSADDVVGAVEGRGFAVSSSRAPR